MLKFLKSKTAKTVGGLMIAGMFLFVSSASAALTTAQVNAIIGLLNSFGADATTVANVQASLTGSTPVVSTSTTTVDFGSATLKVGSKGQYVKNLQSFLGITADGDFGPMTKAKVMAWQSNNGLTADGLFGPASRAKANAGSSSSNGSVVSNPPVVSTGPVVASLAVNNPASGSVLSGQALADLAHFTFTGSGTISKITLQRTGLSVSADVSNVYLFNGNNRLTDSASVNTAGMIVFNNLNLAVNGSRTISVRADIAGTTSSVNLGVNLVSYMTVASTTPIIANLAGNLFSVYAAPAGVVTATLGTTTVNSTPVNAGTMGYTVWSNSLQVNGRVGLLKSLNLHYVGSASTDALANAKLYLDGSQIGSTATVSANGYLFFDLGAGVNLSVSSHTLSVRADIMKGSNRNFQLSLQDSSDLIIADSQIGIDINVTNAVSNGVAGTISINPGSVTVNLDPSFNATTVTAGATNVTLAKYKFTAYGEDMKISSLKVVIAGPASMNNVGLYANSGQVGSSQNYIGSDLTFSLGSSLIIPAGTTTIVEVKADTIDSSNVNITSGTVQVTLKGASNNAQGQTSSNLVTAPSTTGVAGSSLTISTAKATVAVSTTLNSKNILPNTSNTKIGSFVIQAGSTEGVNVTNLQVGLGGTMALTGISNLRTSINSNSIVGNPTTANNFPVNFTIAPSTSKIVDVYADIGSSGTVANANTPTATNVATTSAGLSVAAHQTVTINGSTGTAGTVTATINGYPVTFNVTTSDTPTTAATGLANAINANTNVNGIVVATTSVGVITLTAKTAGPAGNNVTLTASAATTSLTATADGATLLLGSDGATQLNTVTLTGGTGIATGNIYTITIGSTSYSYTVISGKTLAQSAIALAALVNTDSSVSATASAGAITVTALTAGTAGAFTITASAANGTHSTLGTTIIPSLKITAVGATTNVALTTGNGIASALAGQTMTLASGSLGTPSLTTASMLSQFVVGGSSPALATYNFVASNGDATISELKFAVTGTTSAVSKISVDGVSAPVVNGTADVSGLSIVVPVGYAGKDIVVTPTFNLVGLNQQASNSSVIITLNYVKYLVGNQTTTASPSVAANTMTLVGSYPTVAINTTPRTGLSNTSVKLADITITANSNGAIKLRQLPISVSSTGVAVISSQTVVVKDSNGGSIALSAGTLAVATGATGTSSLVFSSPYNIPAGSPVTFGIYATASSVSGAVNTTSLSTSLGGAANFLFDDVNGNVTSIPGNDGTNTNIVNYPTGGAVISN